VGLLDDLKKKADALQTQQQSEDQLRQADIEEVDKALRQTFRYLDELLKQLVVVKPENASTFALPGIGEMKALKFSESFINYRQKREGEREVFDYVALFIKWTTTNELTVVRDLPPAVEKLRRQLDEYNLKYTIKEDFNDRRSLTKAAFSITPLVRSDVEIRGLYGQGKLRIEAKNLLRFGADFFTVPARDIGEPVLEELARMLLGESSGFRRYR
jgi:hypothetical protein